MNKIILFALMGLMSFTACSQNNKKMMESLQGTWRHLRINKFTDDSGYLDGYYTPSFSYMEFNKDSCTSVDNVGEVLYNLETYRIYFSNSCPQPQDEDDTILGAKEAIIEGKYLILNRACTEVYFEHDTLVINYPYARRNSLSRWVRINQIPQSGLIAVSQSKIYSEPNKVTNKYLEKDDQVEILTDSVGWLKIRFYGKKTTEGWIKKEDVESVASSSTASAALPTKTARLLALEAACKSSGLTLVLAQTQEGTTFLINKGDKPLNYFIVQLPSRKQTLGFLTESLRGVEQHFIDDVEAGKVKFNAVLDANGKPVKDRQGFVLNYLTLPSGREAWAFVKQE